MSNQCLHLKTYAVDTHDRIDCSNCDKSWKGKEIVTMEKYCADLQRLIFLEREETNKYKTANENSTKQLIMAFDLLNFCNNKDLIYSNPDLILQRIKEFLDKDMI